MMQFLQEIQVLLSKAFEEDIKRGIHGLQAVISGNYSFLSEENSVDNLLQNKETDFSVSDAERKWAMKRLIELSQIYPKILYNTIQYPFISFSSEKLAHWLREYKSLVGHQAIQDFVIVCQAVKQANKKIIFQSCTFWGGGIIPMLDCGVALLRAMGLDADWHMLWVSRRSFFRTCKSIHNQLLGQSKFLPDWEDYDVVNKENEQLYANLRESEKGRCVFFYEDPQPAGQPICNNDIAVLHIDTAGTKSPVGAEIWEKLSSSWKKAKAFLHQPHLCGSQPLPNHLSLTPGINLLSPKNIPRKSRKEAISNIRNAHVVDDEGQDPWVREEGCTWICIGRPDASKGQIPTLLAFVEDLRRDSSAFLWYFVQFAPDDLHAITQYYMLKLLIEDRPEKRAQYVQKLQDTIAKTSEFDDDLVHALSATFKYLSLLLPQGLLLRNRIQIFKNISELLGDFATLATAHIILSVRDGYNLVLSEMSRHKLPVIANDYLAFRDRVISGERGGWLVTVPDCVMEVDQVKYLNYYTSKHSSFWGYITNVADRLNFVRENSDEARKVAVKLDEWVVSKGHVVRYYTDRLALVLATSTDLENCVSAAQVTERVLSRLKYQTL